MNSKPEGPLVRSSRLLLTAPNTRERVQEVDALLESYRDWWLLSALGHANELVPAYFDNQELGFGLPVAFVERERAAVMMAEFVSLGRARQLRKEGSPPDETEAEVRVVLNALPSSHPTVGGEEVEPNAEELANHVVEAVMRELLRRAEEVG